MATLNLISCGTTEGGNTGIGACPYIPKHFVGAIIGPVGFKLLAAEIATTLQAALKTATHAAKTGRIYPIHGFKALDADNTEAPTKQTFGYGDTKKIRDGKYNLSYQHLDGGICLHKNLRKFNDSLVAAYFIDADGVLIGYKNGDDLQMIPQTDWQAQPMKVSNGSEVSKFLLDFQFGVKYLNESIGFVETADEFTIEDVTGLEDVVLSVQVALDSNKKTKIKLKTSCGGVDLYDQYKTQFSQVTAWVSKTAAGVALTISSVTGDDATKSWELTHGATSYPVNPNTVLTTLAAPSVLKASPISVEGYEGVNTLTQTVPA